MARVNKDKLWNVKDKKWRKFDYGERTYYIPVEGSVNIGDLIKSVPIVNPADSIHVDTHNLSSRGYGGRTMRFSLIDGTTDEVKGPWHTSGNCLPFRITDLHYTFVTIGTEHPNGAESFMSIPDEFIIYQDPGFVLGPFMRGERLARQLADALDKPLYVVSESMGGASAHWVNPGQSMHPMAKRDGDE